MRELPLRLPAEVQAAIRAMHPDLRHRVRAALDRIRAAPGCGKPLTGELEGWWTVRVGRVRIVYRRAPATIDVAAIGPRTSIYVEAARLLRRTR
ncbi:MAG: type II toxin-antitoxin system RelE/ParE family toxin [Deltaproteobacteria bacterium]|nr:MAG: type II toxin-antitoxin system RelE/ParE family toxin [Deltaproteobacteria bacterium]